MAEPTAVLAAEESSLPRVPVGDWVDTAFDWLKDNFEPFFDAVATGTEGAVEGVTDGLLALPPLLFAAILAVLALAVRALARRDPAVRAGPPGRRRPDLVGLLLLLLASALALLVVLRPSALLRDLTWGQVFVGLVPGGRWLTPVGLAAMVDLVLEEVQ